MAISCHSAITGLFDHLPQSPFPRIILIAGVPRSGSTWLFNASRLLLRQAGISLQAVWVEEYDPDHPAAVHLIKAHRPSEINFVPDVVLTTRRPTEACLASLIRMGWLANDPEAIRAAHKDHKALYAHWQTRSDLETSYDTIVRHPVDALSRLADMLELTLSTDEIQQIATTLAQMRAPEQGGYDRKTLLHPNHRKTGEITEPRAADILRIIDTPDT